MIEALTKAQARIRAENGLPQRDRFCDILMDYLKRGVMPFADNDKNYPYHEPEEPQTKEQLWAKLVEQNKKLSPDDPDVKRKLYNHCCMFGTAGDAVDLFEEIQGVPMADSSYRDAIARYLYPVSYTHLDIHDHPPYLRVKVPLSMQAASRMRRRDSGSVSYTHLPHGF